MHPDPWPCALYCMTDHTYFTQLHGEEKCLLCNVGCIALFTEKTITQMQR